MRVMRSERTDFRSQPGFRRFESCLKLEKAFEEIMLQNQTNRQVKFEGRRRKMHFVVGLRFPNI